MHLTCSKMCRHSWANTSAAVRIQLEAECDLITGVMHGCLPRQGLVDLVDRKAYSFEGPNGDSVVEGPVPESMEAEVEQHRSRLVEAVRLLALFVGILRPAIAHCC